jgi:hypothetical protein
MTHAEWSAAVKLRDGCCVQCGRLEDLHAHHIKPKASYPELRFDVSNGKTLCYRCHKLEHELIGYIGPVKRRPTRKSMQRRIDNLELEIEDFEREIEDLMVQNRKLSKLVGECRRGCCTTAIAFLQKRNHGIMAA